MIIIITTLHNKEDAHRICRELLNKRLIVCYNSFPVESAYWWKSKIEEGSETLVIMKTKKDNFEKVEEYITNNSGYDVPEVISVNVDKVNAPYFNWLNTELK